MTGPTRHDHSNTDHQGTNVVVVVVVHPPALSERTLIQRRIHSFLLRRAFSRVRSPDGASAEYRRRDIRAFFLFFLKADFRRHETRDRPSGDRSERASDLRSLLRATIPRRARATHDVEIRLRWTTGLAEVLLGDRMIDRDRGSRSCVWWTAAILRVAGSHRRCLFGGIQCHARFSVLHSKIPSYFFTSFSFSVDPHFVRSSHRFSASATFSPRRVDPFVCFPFSRYSPKFLSHCRFFFHPPWKTFSNFLNPPLPSSGNNFSLFLHPAFTRILR